MIVKETTLSLSIFSSRIILSVTRSLCNSGSCTLLRAAKIASFVTVVIKFPVDVKSRDAVRPTDVLVVRLRVFRRSGGGRGCRLSCFGGFLGLPFGIVDFIIDRT